VSLAAAIILKITDCPSWFDPFFTTKTAHKLLAARRASLHNFNFEWFILALKFFDRVPFLDNPPSAKNKSAAARNCFASASIWNSMSFIAAAEVLHDAAAWAVSSQTWLIENSSTFHGSEHSCLVTYAFRPIQAEMTCSRPSKGHTAPAADTTQLDA
jgi:hypothetical protein